MSVRILPRIEPVMGSDTRFRLVEEFVLPLDEVGGELTIKIKAGFVFDGASIPRLFWPITGHPMDPRRLVASLVHDWLFSNHLLPRLFADALYYQLCVDYGLPSWRAAIEFWALRRYGEDAWNRNLPTTENQSSNQE